MRAYVHMKISTWIFITALFVTPQISVCRRMDKQTIWYHIHTVEHHSKWKGGSYWYTQQYGWNANNYAVRKKADPHTKTWVWVRLHKILEKCKHRTCISGSLGSSRRKLPGVMDMFIVLIGVMTPSSVYTYVETSNCALWIGVVHCQLQLNTT